MFVVPEQSSLFPNQTAQQQERFLQSSTLNTSNIVCPGEKITQDVQFMRGHGTFGDDSEGAVGMFASLAGRVEKVNKLISVIPVRSRYQPEVGDVVVGRILEVQQKKWRVDVRSRLDANLHLAAVNLPGGVQRRKLESDELQMRTFFKEGDLLVAEVQQIGQEGVVSLHTRSLKYGKLRNGVLLNVSPSLIKRSKSHFYTFSGLGIDVILGLNGLIWISKHHDELTLEQIEREPGILYADIYSDSISDDVRVTIARVANCVRVLAANHMMISDSVIMTAYEHSLTYDAKSLLQPDIQEEWIRRVRAHYASQMDQS